jgi:hypothetical protein
MAADAELKLFIFERRGPAAWETPRPPEINS